MFGFGKDKVDKVFDQLNKTHFFQTTPAQNIFRRQDIKNIYDLSADVTTTVYLTLLLHQATFAKRMETETNKTDIAGDYFDLAKQQNRDAEEVMEEDLGEQVKSAKGYCDGITSLLEDGEIRPNRDVGEFCDKYCTQLLTSWMIYRVDVRAEFHSIKERSR